MTFLLFMRFDFRILFLPTFFEIEVFSEMKPLGTMSLSTPWNWVVSQVPEGETCTSFMQNRTLDRKPRIWFRRSSVLTVLFSMSKGGKRCGRPTLQVCHKLLIRCRTQFIALADTVNDKNSKNIFEISCGTIVQKCWFCLLHLLTEISPATDWTFIKVSKEESIDRTWNLVLQLLDCRRRTIF